MATGIGYRDVAAAGRSDTEIAALGNVAGPGDDDDVATLCILFEDLPSSVRACPVDDDDFVGLVFLSKQAVHEGANRVLLIADGGD